MIELTMGKDRQLQLRGGTALVPRPAPGSAFHRHARTRGVPIALFNGLVIGSPITAGFCVGLFSQDLLLGLAASCCALATTPLVNWTGMWGNRRLELTLRERTGSTGEFIGVGCANSNDLATAFDASRMDTDDNVGFISFVEHALVIETEEREIMADSDDIVDITVERMKSMPLMSWIRVTIHDPDSGARAALLVNSRRGHTMRQAKRATLALYQRMVEWHLSCQMGDDPELLGSGD